MIFFLILSLKYTFGPYFHKKYLIWFLFSLFDQFGPQFCKTAFNQVLLANGVKTVNGTVTTCDVARYAFLLAVCLLILTIWKKITKLS